MFIKGKEEGATIYINASGIVKIEVGEKITITLKSNYYHELEKTPELKVQLDALVIINSTKGFESFK